MKQGRVKEVFPGGNTSLGFYSYYDYIIPPDAKRIMVIKGGPGVGKSSFMKTIADQMNMRGYDVELHHCSSDNDSLDGVVFPQLEIAMIDGTSPHIVDPRNPGAVDEILHLGDYWDEKGMRRGKSSILELNREVGRLFGRAYRLLKAAKALYDDIKAINTEGLETGLANQKAADLSEMIFEGRPVAGKPGGLRKLFASAITPDGFRHYLPGIIGSLPTIYALTGAPGTGKSTLLNKIARLAIERGFDCEAYYCAFDPLKIEHLVIEELGVALTTATFPHIFDLENVTGIINMDECIPPSQITKYGGAIKRDREVIDRLFEMVISCLNEAKLTHDKMEEFYVPNMNFKAIVELREKTLERILNYASEKESDFNQVILD